MNYIFVLLLSVMLLLLLAFFLNDQDIMAPSVMMCAMFVISMTFAITCIDNWNINYSPTACYILVSGIMVFLVTETAVRYVIQRANRNAVISKTSRTYTLTVPCVQGPIIIILLCFDVFVLIWFFLEIRRIVAAYGGTYYGLFYSYRQLKTSLASSDEGSMRMTGTVLNQLIKIVQASGYAGLYILICNIVAGNMKWKKAVGLAAVVVVSLLPGFMEGARGGALQFASAALIEYYIVWHQKYGWHRNLSWKYLRNAIALVVIGIPLFYFSLYAVGGSSNKGMFEYAAFYVGGAIQHFNQYIQAPAAPPRIFGEESLIGIHILLHKLGLVDTVRNANLEMRILNNYTQGNIYTFFRRPLHDFGLIGMYIFTCLVAILFTWLYYTKIKNKYQSRKNTYWILLYGYIYYWIVYSSIDQISQSLLSVNCAITLALTFLMFYLMTRVRFVFGEGLSSRRKRYNK